MSLIRKALSLAQDPTHERAARKLIWGFMDLLDAGVISAHSRKDLELIDREAMHKALLVTLTDDLDDQRKDANATKGDLQKMRNELTIQHQVVAKHLNRIGENTEQLREEATVHNEKVSTHNLKVKEILLQVHQALETSLEELNQALGTLYKADYTKNKALLRVITDLAEIKAQLGHCQVDPDKMEIDPEDKETSNSTEGKAANLIVIYSQTQPGIGSPTPPSRETTNKKLSKLQASLPNKKQVGLKNRSGPQQKAQETKTERNPTAVPNPEEDAIELGVGDEEEKKAGFFNWKDLKTRPRQDTQESEIEETPPGWKPATVTDLETELGLKTIEKPKKKELHISQDLPIDIPLGNIIFQCNKESYEDTTPNPSLTVGWDTNGTHPDNAPRIHETIAKDKAARRKAEKIGEDTQEYLGDLEKQLQEMLTPPSQPFNPGEHFLQVQEENRKRQERDRRRMEAQVEEVRAQLLAHGANPPGPPPEPTPLGEYTSIEIETIPIDPRVERNRFGTPEEVPNRPMAPKISPGGRHMGEGSQQVSLIPMEDTEITPGGKHAIAGSKRFTLPPRHLPLPPHQAAQPALPYPPGPQSSRVPSPSTLYPSEGSSVLVVETLAKPHFLAHNPYPKLVMGEKADAEGDTPMSTATLGDPDPTLSSAPTSASKTPSSPPAQETEKGQTVSPQPVRPVTKGKSDAEGDTHMRDITAPVSLPSGAPDLSAINTLVFGDFKKGKATPEQCRTCGNIHNGKCKYRAHDWCDTCQKFHLGRCHPSAGNPVGKTTE